MVALLTTLAASLLVGAAGCGKQEGETNDALVVDPARLLIDRTQLSGTAQTEQSAPELCGPVPVLDAAGGRTAVSETISVGNARVVEAVGLFPTQREAARAYADLGAGTRLDCIGNAIASFQSGFEVEKLPSRTVPAGDEGALIRYRVLAGNTRPRAYSDVVAIRTGRCVAALLIAVGDGGPSAISRRASRLAADGLDSGVCQ